MGTQQCCGSCCGHWNSGAVVRGFRVLWLLLNKSRTFKMVGGLSEIVAHIMGGSNQNKMPFTVFPHQRFCACVWVCVCYGTFTPNTNSWRKKWYIHFLATRSLMALWISKIFKSKEWVLSFTFNGSPGVVFTGLGTIGLGWVRPIGQEVVVSPWQPLINRKLSVNSQTHCFERELYIKLWGLCKKYRMWHKYVA